MLRKTNLILLVLLSIASGVAKIVQAPQEMEFFGAAGFSSSVIIAFGAVQLIGGLMLIATKPRVVGAVIMAITFAASTVIIFKEGQIGFGLFSCLPVLMAGFVVYTSRDSYTER